MARAFSIAASSAVAGIPSIVTAAALVELAHVDAEVQTVPTFDLSAMWQHVPASAAAVLAAAGLPPPIQRLAAVVAVAAEAGCRMET